MTNGFGNMFPGATYPFGMMQLSPDNGGQGWMYAGGYHYADSTIVGFSHTHLSGTGVVERRAPAQGMRYAHDDVGIRQGGAGSPNPQSAHVHPRILKVLPDGPGVKRRPRLIAEEEHFDSRLRETPELSQRTKSANSAPIGGGILSARMDIS